MALIVFLENIGHIHGVNLPHWAMTAIDWLTEEYAKTLLRRLGAYRRYHRVLILEDADATAPNLTGALVEVSATHTVDQLLLVHGQERCLLGYKGQELVDATAFDQLLARYVEDSSLLDLRMVYGVNCYGASLATTWLALGAQAVNGAHAVNWLPEPSLSLFLRKWLNGAPFSEAVTSSAHRASAIGRLLWRDRSDGSEHSNIAGSRQIVYGRRDVTINSPTDKARTTRFTPARKVAATAHPQRGQEAKSPPQTRGAAMPLPSRNEAIQLLHEWVDNEGLRRHMLAVEAAMRVYARHYGEDEDLWGLTGLLHDLDYDRFPDMDDRENGHPRTALRLFRQNDYPPEFIHAVEAHATFLGVPRESKLDKALLACDELTGLILACAYVRPDKDLRGVRLRSVKKKWKDKRFTAAIDRAENLHFIEELGEPFDEHVQRVLDAMKEVAAPLGLSGEQE